MVESLNKGHQNVDTMNQDYKTLKLALLYCLGTVVGGGGGESGYKNNVCGYYVQNSLSQLKNTLN